MKKLKEEKGITLVALIITIVVLLILAVVSIGAVQDSGIIAHAQNAAGGYNQAKGNEVTTLNNYELKIEEYLPKNEENIKTGYYVFKVVEDGKIFGDVFYIESKGTNKINMKYYSIGYGVVNPEPVDLGEITITEENINSVDVIKGYDETEITVEPNYFVLSDGWGYFKGDTLFVAENPGDEETTYIVATFDRNFVISE